MGYYAWRAWRLAGGVPALRPTGLPLSIPTHWWVRLAIYRALHPQHPVPPLPRPERVRGPWAHGRVLYVAWGLPSDNTLSAEATLLAKRCAELAKDGRPKFSALAIEALPENVEKAAALKLACKQFGLAFGIWAQRPAEPASVLVAKFSADFYIANVEVPGDGMPEVLSVPRIVCLETGGGAVPDAAAAKAWIDAGYDCQPEAYTVDNPNSTVLSETFQAQQRGWPPEDIYPVVGVYHNYPLSLYGEGWNAVYLFEGMQPSDWDF